PSTEPTPIPTLPPGPPLPTATLWLFQAINAGTGALTLAPPVPTWSGPLDLQGTVVMAGDATGDALADLIVQADATRLSVPATGVRELVIRAGAAAGTAPEPWLDVP